MSKALSWRMRECLRRIVDKGGRLEFISGLKTYAALERRGLVELDLVPGMARWSVTLTDAGREVAG